MKITLVKKLLSNGEFCAKCNDVQQKLDQSGYIDHISEVVIADETDPSSPGMILATQHNVSYAPFFIVEREGEFPEVHTVYFKFIKEVINPLLSSNNLEGIMGTASDEDFA